MIELHEKQNNHHFWQLNGELTRFDDLSSFPTLPSPDQAQVDVSLADVTKIDTAGIAYLLKLKITLAEKGIQINYFQGSENFINLAKLYGVDELLGIN